MDSSSSHPLDKPERLKTLASKVSFPGGNILIHQFVLDHSEPNDPGRSRNYVRAVLLSMYDVPADVANALNDDGCSPLHLAVLKKDLLMVKKLLSCFVNVDVNATCRRGKRNTALHLAAELGHLPIIQELLNNGADIDIENARCETALCVAVRSRNLDTVIFLVSEGASVNRICWGNYCRAALCHAVDSGHLEAVEFLVSNGADISAKSALHTHFIAAKSGNLDIKFLLDRGVNFDFRSQYATYLLFTAVESGILATVEFLVSKGVDINAEICDLNPLYTAIEKGSSEMVEFFIDHGADLQARNKRGCTPLHSAVQAGSLDCVKLLMAKGADLHSRSSFGKTPLHFAALGNDLEILAFLVSQGADTNARDYVLKTPLHDALINKNVESAAFLLDQGAELYADICGRTPLHYAASTGEVDITRALVVKGADVNAKGGDYGRTPLHHAVVGGNLEIVAFLLDQGAELYADRRGRTPLHIAACRYEVDITRALLVKGADVNAKDDEGRTPLHDAVVVGSLEIVALVLDQGAELYADIDGRTPLHYAVSKGEVDITRALLVKGADVNAKDDDGKTPLDLATERKHQLCMDALQNVI